jgi:hypothetical protein
VQQGSTFQSVGRLRVCPVQQVVNSLPIKYINLPIKYIKHSIPLKYHIETTLYDSNV